MSLIDDMAKEGASQSEQKKKISDEGLSVVGTLAKQQLELESKISAQEKILATLNDEHKLISQTKLPEALEEYGLSEVKLADGKKIKVKKFYGASIKPEQREAAFKWLRENGFGDLIKRAITATFGKGEDKNADKVFAELSKQGLSVADKTDVHGSTLKAFVKEQKEEGKTIPDALFGVFEGKIATVE